MSKALTEKLSLQEGLKEFLFDCKLRKLSERTTKSYKNNNLSFFRYIETEYELTLNYFDKHPNIKPGTKEKYIASITENMRKFTELKSLTKDLNEIIYQLYKYSEIN